MHNVLGLDPGAFDTRARPFYTRASVFDTRASTLCTRASALYQMPQLTFYQVYHVPSILPQNSLHPSVRLPARLPVPVRLPVRWVHNPVQVSIKRSLPRGAAPYNGVWEKGNVGTAVLRSEFVGTVEQQSQKQ